jgi:hypothetical protein
MVVDVLWASYVMASMEHVCGRHCEIVANVLQKLIKNSAEAVGQPCEQRPLQLLYIRSS